MSGAYPRSGRVESSSTSHLIRSGSSAKSAGDSLQTSKGGISKPNGKRSYVTRSRVEAIRSHLSDKQRHVIADVDKLGIVSGKQLQLLHYGPSAAGGRLARMHLGQLVRWQVLTRMGRTIGGERAGSAGYVYSLGPAGQRLEYPDRSRYVPRWTPRPGYLRHALAVSELYVSLRQLECSGSVELLAYDTEPRCWRRYFGPGGAPSLLKPDSLAIVGLSDFEYRYFIEVDCSTEHRPQIINKAKTYVRYYQSGREQAETGIFPFVLWSVPNERRADLLIGALTSLPAEHWQLFMVTTSDHAAERIAGGHSEAISNREEVT
jgi:protein involved in plasmid replication-relaxation